MSYMTSMTYFPYTSKMICAFHTAYVHVGDSFVEFDCTF